MKAEPGGLGRLPAPDDRDQNYLIREVARLVPTRTFRNWWDTTPFLDQGREGACVGFSWTHWLACGPVTQARILEDYSYAFTLYKEAQKIDEWPGENYSGTSVRAAAKVLVSRGIVGEYRWAFTLEDVVNTVLEVGPVVMGTNWYTGMFDPDSKGFLNVTGQVAGGHAWTLTGVNLTLERFRMKNSWGAEWGNNGRAYISFADLERLIQEDGEACIAREMAA